MTLNNYRVQYQCVGNDGKILKEGTIIAKRKASEFEALTGLEKHLKTKIEGMAKMICVKIRIDMGALEDILNNNPFGGRNPFGL